MVARCKRQSSALKSNMKFFADIIVYMTIMDFSCISLDSLYNFTHDWLYYIKKSYDEIEAGMAYIGSFSEVLKITWQYFCLHVDRMRKYFCPRRMRSSQHALRCIWLIPTPGVPVNRVLPQLLCNCY